MSKATMTHCLIFLVCLLTLISCDQREESPVPPATAPGEPSFIEKFTKLISGDASKPRNGEPISAPAQLLKVIMLDSVEPVLYELPSQALATWREFGRYRPILVLFSTHPLLDPIPAERQKTIGDLMREGSAKELAQRASLLRSDPAVLPPETVSVAIDHGLFAEIVVVLPNNKPPEEVDLARFSKRALLAGFLTEAEASGLSLNDGTISGTVRGIPLRIAHPDKLPKIEQPVVLHVDLGFFKDSYINEVKSPSYNLLQQLATSLKDAGYNTLATTLSFSNQEVGFSLESRFLIRDLAELLRQPQLLDGGTPASWTLRSGALYAASMFAESKARELTMQAVQENPEDAAAHYALAMDLFEQKMPDQAFASLDRAVALDRGYALEYIALAERGFEIRQSDKAIELLAKAAQILPENPFIRLQLANQLIRASRVKEARPIIAELLELKWSEVIYPETVPLLKRMQEAAAIDVIVPLPATEPRIEEALPNKPAGRMPGFNHMGMGGPGHG